MKKIIALLLVSVICISLVACNNSQGKENTEEKTENNLVTTSEEKSKAEKAILGTWEYNGATITFNSDYTGVIIDTVPEGDADEIIWSYNEDMNCYLYTSPLGTPVFSVFMHEDENGTYILTSGNKFYRQNNE